MTVEAKYRLSTFFSLILLSVASVWCIKLHGNLCNCLFKYSASYLSVNSHFLQIFSKRLLWVTNQSEIWCSHGGECENSYLLGCDGV